MGKRRRKENGKRKGTGGEEEGTEGNGTGERK